MKTSAWKLPTPGYGLLTDALTPVKYLLDKVTSKVTCWTKQRRRNETLTFREEGIPKWLYGDLVQNFNPRGLQLRLKRQMENLQQLRITLILFHFYCEMTFTTIISSNIYNLRYDLSMTLSIVNREEINSVRPVRNQKAPRANAIKKLMLFKKPS